MVMRLALPPAAAVLTQRAFDAQALQRNVHFARRHRREADDGTGALRQQLPHCQQGRSRAMVQSGVEVHAVLRSVLRQCDALAHRLGQTFPQ